MLKKSSIKAVINGSFCSFLLWGGALHLAQAQTAPDQLELLGRVQDQQDAQRVAAQRAQQEAMLRAQAEQERAERAREAARERRANALAQEKRAKLQDDRAFKHAKREIEIEKEKAQLQFELAKAKHSEDYVQADLNQKHAETDRVAATNDAVRGIASGTEHLLEDSGKAKRMKQRHWWQWKD